MKPTVLLIDDKETWGGFIADNLQDDGFNVVWKKSKPEAESCLEENSQIQAVITNLNLKDGSFLDGNGYLILEHLQKNYPQLPKIAISALGDNGQKVVELYSQYKVDYVVIKSSTDSNLVPDLVHTLHQLISARSIIAMNNWEAAIAIVVSVISPYVAALGIKAAESVGSKLGEAVPTVVNKLWMWVRNNVDAKGQAQDKKLLNDFQQEPTENQDNLKQALLRLVPTEDIALQKLTRNLCQELYKLLDNDDFTLMDVTRICNQVDVRWENEVADRNKYNLAHWVIIYTQANHKERELIEAIVKIKPAVFLGNSHIH